MTCTYCFAFLLLHNHCANVKEVLAITHCKNIPYHKSASCNNKCKLRMQYAINS